MIVSIGEALIDFIARNDQNGEEVFRPAPGGSPYNTTVALARLGAPVAYLARISTDIFGEMLMKHLEENDVDISMIVRTSQPSTLAFVRRRSDGRPEYAFYAEGSADRSLDNHDLPDPMPEAVDCIQCGSISLCLEPGATTIESFVIGESERRFVSLDPNIRASMIEDGNAHRKRIERIAGCSGLVKTSDEDLAWLYPGTPYAEAAGRLISCGATLVVVTAGTEDTLAVRADGTTIRTPVRASSGGDTVGAGDTFHAALIAWFERSGVLSRDAVAALSETDLRRALEFATAAAAITCSRVGADPPELAELPPTVL